MEKIIKEALKKNIRSKTDLSKIKRQYAKHAGVPLPTNMSLLKEYNRLLKKRQIKKNLGLEELLKTRNVRSLSGVSVVSVLTKPYPCPGRCLYCPTEKGMPKSYLSNEPAVMRAILNEFHPARQVQMRLRALKQAGHPTDKIELIVIGGTWSYLPKRYQTWFIKECFRACNETTPRPSLKRRGDDVDSPPFHGGAGGGRTLLGTQKLNETAKHRIVGITLETRPDFINKEEVKRMRMLGATRVELGVQSLYDDVLYKNHRGHGKEAVVNATKLLRDAGFKICYHMMPGLPGSTIAKDKKMMRELFDSPDFRPDMLKIYPCVVLKEAKLYKLWKEKKYKPLTEKQLFGLMAEIKKNIPYYVRINRLIRDIPTTSIIAGNMASNLRQLLKNKGIECNCIRCREAGHQHQTQTNADCTRTDADSFCNSPREVRNSPRLFREDYDASKGKEIFLSFESSDRKTLYAFLRLRIRPIGHISPIGPIKNDFALIRELHTYGQAVDISNSRHPPVKLRAGSELDSGSPSKIQHRGLGKKLISEAERIIKKEYPEMKKIAIISGVGVREYYKKLGYKLEKTYMVKKFNG